MDVLIEINVTTPTFTSALMNSQLSHASLFVLLSKLTGRGSPHTGGSSVDFLL